MTRRAIQKKLAKKFQVGDVVIWGTKRIAHRIVEVQAHGVVVDSTSTKFGQQRRPRHTFPEDWDSAAHPRFDFEHIQHSFENLIAKGYTVQADPDAVRIRNKSEEIVFEMELPRS